MSDNEVTNLELFKKFKKNQLPDRGKIVYGYHLLRERKVEDAKKILASISKHYYVVDIHKDISRALLCWATYQITNDLNQYRESEFYVVISKLVKMVAAENLIFNNSGYFHELRTTLFKGFDS